MLSFEELKTHRGGAGEGRRTEGGIERGRKGPYGDSGAGTAQTPATILGPWEDYTRCLLPSRLS